MADVLNRTTKEFRRSVNDPDYSPAEWIINPDMSAVAGFPSIYWTITGDTVSLMSQAERDAVDAAILTAQRDAAVAQLTQLEDVLRAFMLVVMDEFNAHANRLNAITATVDGASNLAQFAAAMQSINDYPTRTAQQLRTAIRAKLGVSE